jgi:predicted kinase
MPGSGKTFFARQFCTQVAAAHLQADRIRSELFEKPAFTKEEDHVITSLMGYMTSEFLHAGISVVFDADVMRLNQRRALRNLAIKKHAQTVLLWIQIDPDSAYHRASKRDRRKQDDQYAQDMEPASFRTVLSTMQNPDLTENYLVLSGKHVFSTQKNAVLRYLTEKRLLTIHSTSPHMSKPGLVNIVPNPAAGRVDMTRRNISIR